MAEKKTLGQVAYEAYGNLAGAHGAWKTFDGREMPQWEALHGEAGELTRRRWEAGVRAALAECEWDPFAHSWRQKGQHSGRAINPNNNGA